LENRNPIIFQGEWEGKSYQDNGVVQEYIPYQKLAYSYLSNWSGLPDVRENYLLISYEVKKVTEGTVLTITQGNYDAEKAKHSEENWAQIVDAMKKLIE